LHLSTCGSLNQFNQHSFPTRRSSDLALELRLSSRSEELVDRRETLRLIEERGVTAVGRGERPEVRLLTPLLDEPECLAAIDEFRSEEHTTELQSTCNLVCRPPLAYKK